MNKSLFIAFLLPVLLSISCVPQSDLTYLQQKNTQTNQIVNEVSKKPYRVQSNDVLVITIKTLDQKLSEMFLASANTGGQRLQSEQALYFEGYTVDDHGSIRVPVLGEVFVLGSTTDEVRIEIEKRLLDEYFKKEANVFVNVKLGGLRYTINGEVNSPGTKLLFQEKANILEAIANAGDITMVGDRKNVLLVRQMPHGTEMYSLDLTDASVMQSPYYYIQPNDYILVNPLKQKSWGTGTTGIQSISTLISILSLVTTVIILTSR
ncbi:polysaccharide biosynthesis/export family protein [Flavobacterium sp. UBA6135]|uniref:polysaccharide biosynthesis/export family protein n=1 Tax=Flavobacterium sp. UBA6135 TaxID=1946553 RepID=UPI0025B99769|nr:polysaccharide biosynthesis/export family protein [Flavobacterium sp. UBA6135]